MPSAVFECPSELLFAFCAQVYFAGLPAHSPSLDPLITNDYGIPTSLPSSVPAGNWSEQLSRRTLASLCLVNHAWYEAAKPWLWRSLQVRLPRTWLSIVEEIAGSEDEDVSVKQAAVAVGHSIKAATDAAMASTVSDGTLSDKETARKLEERILASLSGPDGAIPLELLSPPASRDPSPRRLRTKKSASPARWKIMKSICNAVQNVMNCREPGVYVPAPHDPRPGRYVRHLDFNHFRTIGMRRSIEEGINSRFVTGERVELVLKEMPNLTAFGATEYMDGALTLNVLKELFLRGTPSVDRGRPSRGRVLPIADGHEAEEEDRERRRECRELEAIDLTGCVSAVFANALTEFVTAYLLPSAESNEEGLRDQREPLVIPGLQRLGLRGVRSILPRILTPFVLAFPSLTHLDLSGTRVTPELLASLGESPTVRLRSLSLARCTKLTSESLKNFLVYSPVAGRITELSLYGDVTFSSPLTPDDLHEILAFAPCFTSGEMEYLDLSSTPLTQDMLLHTCKPQPKLRSLGLSHIPDIELSTIAEFLKVKARNVEIITLVGTSPELDCRMRTGVTTPRHGSAALHTQIIRPLCTPPFVFCLNERPIHGTPPTRLRVIELATPMLCGLGVGAGSWRIVRSKGGRGWYVDTSSGWVTTPGETNGDDSCETSELRRDLEVDHPLRRETERWADANGNVSSGVGWHARKMEILHGQGMLGREDGLYGAVSFAYQG